jgi:hypothetical protein
MVSIDFTQLCLHHFFFFFTFFIFMWISFHLFIVYKETSKCVIQKCHLCPFLFFCFAWLFENLFAVQHDFHYFHKTNKKFKGFITLPSKANLSHAVLWSSHRQPVIFFTNQWAVRDSDYRCATACIVVAWLHNSIELLRVHFCFSQMFLLSPLNLLQFSCKKVETPADYLRTLAASALIIYF